MPQIQIEKKEIVKFFKSKLKYIDLDIKEESVHDINSWLAVLLENDKTRYEKALSAKELWKLFTEKSLRKITTNLRGFADLSHYFDDYLEYEDILFALDKEYRDHTIHSIWVMLLGYYLLEKCRIFGDIEFDCVTEFPNEGYKKASKDTVDTIREKYKTPLWFLIALTHDLGYPIQKTQKVNEKTKEMISNFGILSLKELEYNFTIAHHTAIDELLNSLASQIKYKPESNESSASYQIGHVSGKRLDYAKSFERLDHGIMSAYLLQLYLDFICDELRILRGVEGECYYDCKKAAIQAVVIDLLNSISAHSCKTRFNRKFNTMESLLLISDELEEFSRYSSESKTHEWREFQCKTHVNYLFPPSLYIYFTFDDPDIEYDIEKFFWGKVKKLHGFFELPNSNITELSIKCEDRTKPTDHKEYIYKKNSSGALVTYPISDNWEDYWEWRPTNGSISVSSSPSGADVSLDEEKQGPTRYTFTNVLPRYTIKNVPPGDHRIKLTLEGYQNFSTGVKVTAGHTTVVHATLKPTPTPPIISMSKT